MHTPSVETIVRGVLRFRDSILLCRNRQHGHIFLPGGHIDFDEPAAIALEREMREELGAELRTGRFMGACEAGFDQARKSGGTRRHHEINLVFELLPVDPAADLSKLSSAEAPIEFIWRPIDELISGYQPVLPTGIVALLASPAPAEPAQVGWFSSFT